MVDKTPAWLNWASGQAVELEKDKLKRMAGLLGASLGGEKPAAPAEVKSDFQKLRSVGIGKI